MNEFDKLNKCANDICKVPKIEMSFNKKPHFSLMIMGGMVIIARLLGHLVFYLRHKKYYYDAEIEKKLRKREASEAKEIERFKKSEEKA